MKDGRLLSGSSSSPWRRERRRVDQTALAAPAILLALYTWLCYGRDSVVGVAGHDRVPFSGSLLNLDSSSVLEVPEVILMCGLGWKTTAVDCLKESGG